MIIAFASSPFGVLNPQKPVGADCDFRQIGTVIQQQPDGRFALQWGPTSNNGIVPVNPPTMLSCQPDGSFETRPLVAPGNYELFTLNDGALIIRPNWEDGHAIFPNAPTVAYAIAAKVIG